MCHNSVYFFHSRLADAEIFYSPQYSGIPQRKKKNNKTKNKEKEKKTDKYEEIESLTKFQLIYTKNDNFSLCMYNF